MQRRAIGQLGNTIAPYPAINRHVVNVDVPPAPGQAIIAACRLNNVHRLALLRYARKLTLSPESMARGDVEALHAAGADDGEILEVNQVTAYFNYANRSLNGLGVSLEGDVIGYYAPAETLP